MKRMLQGSSRHIKLSQCLKSLVNWFVPDTDATQLAQSLLDELRTSVTSRGSQGNISFKRVDVSVHTSVLSNGIVDLEFCNFEKTADV